MRIVKLRKNDISAVYDAGELVATLVNGATGKGISGASVKFVINNQQYTVKTSSKGEAKLSDSSLAPGSYTATVSYKGNSKYAPSNVTVDIVSKISTSISLYYDAENNCGPGRQNRIIIRLSVI